MIRVGIVGATGYGGRELLRLLMHHPKAETVAVASTTVAGQRLDEVLPAFRQTTDLVFQEFNAKQMAAECDLVIVAVPGRESMKPVQALRAEGARVIDIGPDFRLKDAESFAQYYKTDHIAPELLEESVYGLVPWYREKIKTAKILAVPGCYPIGCLLPLRPLMEAPLTDIPIVIDGVSGVSGAGRTLAEPLHFAEMNENLRAYKVGVHQHIPEIEQELLHKTKVQFTPHVAPLTRGILSTMIVRPQEKIDVEKYYACYQDEPFVRVLGEGALPETKHARGSNHCDIGWYWDERTGNLVVLSAVDNLTGGTAGMALQAMNLMFGIEETAGLKFGGMSP